MLGLIFVSSGVRTHTSTNTHTNTTDACICIKSLYKFHGQDHGSKAATQIHLYSFPNSNMQQLPRSRLLYSPPLQNCPPPHTHTHICWVQFTKNLIAKHRHICKPFQMLLLSWTRSCRRTGHCIHCATPPPRSGHLKEIQGSRVEDGMWVYVRGEQQETHPPFSCSGGLYCPGSVLKPSSSLPCLNSFKIFFFTDTPQAPYPHPNAKQ